jgi:hypothetical protein
MAILRGLLLLATKIIILRDDAIYNHITTHYNGSDVLFPYWNEN